MKIVDCMPPPILSCVGIENGHDRADSCKVCGSGRFLCDPLYLAVFYTSVFHEVDKVPWISFCLFAIWSERSYALPINESKQRLRPSHAHAGVIKRWLLLRSYSAGSHATEPPIRSRSHSSVKPRVKPDWAGPFRTDDLLVKFILPLGI